MIQGMIFYILGILTGLSISCIVFMVTLYSKPKVERIINQVTARLKEKGVILELENEEINQWVENLKNE